MAVATVIEFSNMPIVSGSLNNPIPVGCFNANTVLQTPITLSTSSISSATFAATTCFIRIHNSGICNFKVGAPGTTASTTAGGGAGRLPADHTEYLGVNGGQCIAFITDT